MEGGRGSSFSSRFFAVLAAQAVSIPGGVTVGSTAGTFGPFSLSFAPAGVVAFFSALWHGFAMGWDLLWAGLRMGAVAGNF